MAQIVKLSNPHNSNFANLQMDINLTVNNIHYIYYIFAKATVKKDLLESLCGKMHACEIHSVGSFAQSNVARLVW